MKTSYTTPFILLLTLLFIHCGPALIDISDTLPPDSGKRAVGENGMVVSAHPLASEIGLEVLQDGGNAIDAAVATTFAVGVVEPMMGGLGGSGSMLIWLQNESHTTYLDFYARSPMNPDTNVHHYTYADMSPLGVAVPGTVAGLLEAHERYGKLSRERVIRPAVELAENGFPVHALLSRIIARDSTKLNLYDRPGEIFWPDGKPLQAGDILIQPELAETLRRIATDGRDGFYKGDVAEDIISVLSDLGNPMTGEDLELFEPKWKRPVCGVYRNNIVLSAPPPQSGFQIVQTLNLLEPHDLSAMGLPTRSFTPLNLIASSIRVSTADRIRYLGDPDFYPIPVGKIVSKEYALHRQGDIVQDFAPEAVHSGIDVFDDEATVPDKCREFDPYQQHTDAKLFHTNNDEQFGYNEVSGEADNTQTTHLSVIDADGNAVALTFTVGVYFGSGVWAAGSFLNSSQHIFSDDPESPNALGPGRTPRSTTTPTIVLSEGSVRLIAGAAGANRIPTSVIQNILYIIDYGMDPIDAIRMPRLFSFASSPLLQLEHGFAWPVYNNARIHGYETQAREPFELYFGGVHLIGRKNGVYIGVADPRRDGEARSY